MTADVARRVMGDGDVVQLAAGRHEHFDRPLVDDDPAPPLPAGSGVLLLEAAEGFRRDANSLRGLLLTRALFHQLQGFFELAFLIEELRRRLLGQIFRPGVSTRLRTAFSACQAARDSGLILFVIISASLWFGGHKGAPVG